MAKKRKPGRPKGGKSLEPRAGSLRAVIVKSYDLGFSSTTELAEFVTLDGHPCTTNDVCAALKRWRPGWYEKMHGGLELAEYATMAQAVDAAQDGDSIISCAGGYRIKRRDTDGR